MNKHFSKSLNSWLDLQKNEMSIVFLALFSLFCISASNVLFGNFSETAFLKRFGIEYLPTLLLINAFVTFVMMSLISRWLMNHSGHTVLRMSLVFCGLSSIAARLIIPLNIEILYPVMYVMNTQYELLLTFLFWNLANQIFPARQSKRLFPLFVMGGIVGGMSSSFATPFIAKIGSIDNILWVYFIGTMFASIMVNRLVHSSRDANNIDKNINDGRTTLMEGVKKALPVMKISSLVRWLVVLTLIPNIILPILNYQVSFAVDMTYGDEEAMLQFYSLYRGSQFVLALIVCLFSTRIYKRFGLSGGLLVHPFNYMILFVVFMLQFDIYTAIYAGISAGVIRRAIQTPARASLVSMLPNEQRILLMPFLRGVVVRIGTLIGAVFVLVCQSEYFQVCNFPLHPQNLAPFGLTFALLWLIASIRMRAKYPEMILGTLGWHGTERGRLILDHQIMHSAQKKLIIVRNRLAQASAISYHRKDVLAGKLIEHLCGVAERLSRDILSDIESHDLSGRLKTIKSAINGKDRRGKANAIEALEQLLPRVLSKDLIRGLEKIAPRKWSSLDSVIGALLKDSDPVVRRLAAQIGSNSVSVRYAVN